MPLMDGLPPLSATIADQQKQVAAQQGEYDQAMAGVNSAGRGGPDLAMLGLAAGMLRPTKTGSFGESMGYGLSGMMSPLQQARAQDLDRAQKIAALRIARSKLQSDYLSGVANTTLAAGRTDAYNQVGRGRGEGSAYQRSVWHKQYVDNAPDETDTPDVAKQKAALRQQAFDALRGTVAAPGAGSDDEESGFNGGDDTTTGLSDRQASTVGQPVQASGPPPVNLMPETDINGNPTGGALPPSEEDMATRAARTSSRGAGARVIDTPERQDPAERKRAIGQTADRKGKTWNPETQAWEKSDPAEIADKPARKDPNNLPPAPGAKMAPDGNWYIKRGDKWAKWNAN